MISGTAGSTSFFLKKFCWETNRFSRYAWRVNDVVHRKTAGDRKDLQSCSKRSRMPMTLVTRRSVRGSAISFLRPFPQTKLTDGYASVGNIEPDTSVVVPFDFHRAARFRPDAIDCGHAEQTPADRKEIAAASHRRMRTL